MAESVGTAAGGHPNLNLTPEEKRVYGQLFKEADPDGFGAVSGDVAVKFFEKTKLPPDVLGQIWQIADNENRGFLTPSGFGVVLRLIGHAQAGRVPLASISAQPAPLPRFDGMTLGSTPIAAQSTGTPSSPTQAGAPPIRVPALGPEKVAEYSALFEKSGAENGMLYGGTAKQIFERAKLHNDVLGRIWTLADTQGRGSLDVTEFVIAMHLLASFKSGAMRGVPSTLPPGLYEAASRRPPPRMGGGARPGSASGMAGVGIFPQTTGYNQRPQSPVTRQQAGTPLSTQSTGDWAITIADKARFDAIFASVDKQGLGYLNGEQAVEFFGNARLPEETLAQIWDLADINSEGRLDRDEFAVAMYLIRQQRGTKDGRGNLPSVLPPSLIPPSRRRQQIPPSQPTAPAFENAPVTQPRSAAEDLFGLDVLAPTQPPAPQVAQSTGGTDTGPFANPRSPQMASSTIPAAAAPIAASSVFRPFEPSSTFGRSLAPQSTGSPAPGQSRTIPATIAENDDLLGDADPVQSQKLTNETSELGNLSNQVSNLSKQMSEVHNTRSQAEQELSQNTQQKRAFESRLSQLRSAYEKEVQEVKALQDQLTTSRNETKRLQQDMAMIEGSHADLQTQHQQLRTAFETDQRENASLKEKIRQLNVEIEQLKPQIEKFKSDARQQKGLVAINKKQLATNELERERIRTEISAAAKEHEDALKELEETHRQLETSKAELETARAVPPPTVALSPRALASPAASVSSNPFMRRTTTGTSEATFSPPIVSPEPVQESHSAFDNIFGPSFAAPPVGTAAAATTTITAPTTSFRSETPPVGREISPPEAAHSVSSVSSFGTSTPQVIPPAPAATKQLTSDALPFRPPLDRAESIGSSVQVAHPASRLSPADTPRALTPSFTPDVSTPSPTGQTASTEHSSHIAGPDEEQESVRQAVADTATSNEKASEIPGAFPDSETPATETPAPSVDPTAVAVGAGAAAIAAGAGIAAMATTQHQEKEEAKRSSPVPQANNVNTNNFDEYFGGPAHQRTPSEQVKDFDSAFASMRTGLSTTGTTGGTTQEFPDIHEIEDDDSSTDTEEAPMGFEDDFSAAPTTIAATNSATTPAVAGSKAQGKQPEGLSAIPSHLQFRPQLGTASSTASSLPGIEREISPPTYGDSVPSDNPSHFPPEFKGLLPEREDPTSPPPVIAGGSSSAEASARVMPPAYGPEVAHSQDEALKNVAHQAAVSSTSKPPAFDFDSAFAGVGPAQVEDDDSDDAETNFGSTHHQTHEFDPSFDSPAQSRAANVTSNTHSPSAYHAVTNGSTSVTEGTSGGNSFFGFGDTASAASTAQTAATTQETSPQVSHDWDALFAPLNAPSTSEQAPQTSIPQFTTTAPQETTTSYPVSTEELGPGTSQKAGPSGGTLKPERPQPGRALSEGTEHDDPILKRLTSMGWSRTESLAALEKFDYNIDKAADYLTFQS